MRLGVRTLACLLFLPMLLGCSGGGDGGATGGGSGPGIRLALTASFSEMPASTGEDLSTQVLVARVCSSAGEDLDGVRVTFSADSGWFLDDEGSRRGSLSVESHLGRASVVYAAPTRPASVRIGAQALGARAWVTIHVWRDR